MSGQYKERIIKLSIIGTTLVFGVVISTANILKNYSATPSSAQTVKPPSTDCDYQDVFLCKSLALLNQTDFLNKISMGTITSFDGATKVKSSWSRDLLGNYTFSSSNDDVEADRVVYKNKQSHVLDKTSREWVKQPTDVPQNPKVDSETIVDQLGIDEDIGHFFVDNPIRKNYTLQNLGRQKCGSLSCIEFLALDKNTSPDVLREYLYFDETNNLLIKYRVVKPEYQAEYTFGYDPVPTISEPSITP